MNPSTNWLDYVENKCGATARTQFENAIRRHSTNLFVENILADDQNIMRDGKHYYGLSDKANTLGRNQDLARSAADDLAKGNAVDWTKYQRESPTNAKNQIARHYAGKASGTVR